MMNYDQIVIVLLHQLALISWIAILFLILAFIGILNAEIKKLHYMGIKWEVLITWIIILLFILSTWTYFVYMVWLHWADIKQTFAVLGYLSA